MGKVMNREFETKTSRRDFFKKVGISTAVATTLTSTADKIIMPAFASKGTKYAMLIDLRRCTGCRACQIACKSEFNVPLGYFMSSVKELTYGKYPDTKRDFVPWLCNHCSNPPCIDVCPVEPKTATFTFKNGVTVEYEKRATYKRPDGPVLVDHDRCTGCEKCVDICPYRVRFINPEIKAGGDKTKNSADKCTFCAHRIDEGVVPSCVNTCTGRARIFGDINDSDSEISKIMKENKTKVLLADLNTEPNVYYINLNEQAYEKGEDVR